MCNYFEGIKKMTKAAHTGLLHTTALVAALGAGQALAQSPSFAQTGFSISLDEQTLAGAPALSFNTPYTADALAYGVNVDIRYDGLDTRRMLNISTADLRGAYGAGQVVPLRSSANYPAFIARSEVRIIDTGLRGNPVVATLPATANGVVNWTMPAEGSGNFAYVLRVYDASGRFDETTPVPLSRADSVFDTLPQTGAIAAGEAEDNTARRNIPVRGGLITASGSGATPGGTVEVMGETVPVDSAGRFVVSRILPVGDQVVTVNANGRNIVRDVQIPASDWFKIGIADITAGLNFGGAGNLDAQYVNGRVAFYVKGRTASGWRITSSLDTGNGPISGLLSRLNDKDPRRVLDRLRLDGDIYPTYGDDSSYFDDTPTAGAIYLRAENENFRITWGNFTAGMNSASLLHSARDLYGAELRYQSTTTTERGAPRFSATVYAAQPDTLAQRDILQGTGGSVYFLTRQDITGGSVRLAVQVVDPATGRVISSTNLQPGADYSIDHIQGMVLLDTPLASTASSAGVVSGGGDEYTVNLVALYEYTPTGFNVNDTAYGARGDIWLSNNLRFGATYMSERTAAGTQQMASADLRYQIGEASFAALEVAKSSGPGMGFSTSTDGGLTIISTAGVASTGATALHFESYLDLRDLGVNRDGFVNVYYDSKDAGFSTISETITTGQSLVGVEAGIALGTRLTFGADAEFFRQDNGNEKLEGEVRLAFALSDQLSLEAGVQLLDQTTVGIPSETGQRTDLGVRLSYAPTEGRSFYLFGQATLDNVGGLANNNRYGAGFDLAVSEKLDVSGEISTGNAGLGGALRLTYAATDKNEVYLGYTLDPTRGGAGGALSDNGRVVLGGKYQLSDSISTYTEYAYDMPDDQRSLSQIYGVTYTPSDAFTLSSTVELGSVRDAASGDFDRLALSLGVAKDNGDGQGWRARLEYRDEQGAGTARDRTTWGLTAGYNNSVNDNWRLLANVDALLSESADGAFRDGRYIKASLGYAFRPVDNDKFNMLLRYTYLNDQPGEDQVSADGTDNGPLQISNIFSVSAGYDLSSQFTLGGKLGYRSAQVAPRGTTAFTSNTAALAAVRLDWHMVSNWDAMAEIRLLHTVETGTNETGAVAAIYRQLGENLKIGAGFEWGAVSDNMTNLDYSGQGLFLNLVAKY